MIALLTDFGHGDHYVGVMKGVILGICPEAQLVDITHQVPPQDVVSAMLTLDDAYRFFPAATVFLCVVDPGVGSERRGIAVEADGYRFVGPDNGLFSRVIAGAETPARFVELTSTAHARPEISRTFEGRDRFAPAAAWLARGVRLDRLGEPLADVVARELPAPRASEGGIEGEVIAVDHFGNLITNIDRALLGRLAAPYRVSVDGRPVPHVVKTYAEVPIGEVCALVGSGARLEVAVRNGSARRVLAVDRGAAVHVHSAA